MLRKTVIALCSFAMVAASLAAYAVPQVQAQTGSGLRLISEYLIPGSLNVKWPHVAAGRGQVTVSGNVNKTSAVAWTKAATAEAFGAPFDLGPAEGDPDWSSTSVAIGPDGSTWVTWVNQPARAIYLRQRNPQGQWGPRRTVDTGASFPVNPEVAVTSSNQIFVAWRDADRPIRYRFSTNAGENWSSRRDVTDVIAYKGAFGLATGTNGQVGVTFNAGAGDRLQIFVGLWNGTSFVTSRVSPGGADWADPTLTFAPNGRAFVAWRGTATSGGNSGVFFAEQQPDGTWPRSRLIGGNIIGNVGISSDEQGNIHVGWVGSASGAPTVYYAFKPASGPFTGPIASGDNGTLFGPRLAASVTDAPYGHIVSEEFSGSRLFTRYSLFGANVVTTPGGEPLIEGGAARVAPAADSTVKLTFRNVTGGANQVRWRWGAAPTDAASDSAGWQPLAAEMRVSVPAAIRNDTSCQASLLYTQMRNSATGVVETQVRSASTIVDAVAEAGAYLDNPFARAAPQQLQSQGALAGVEGAPGGAPNYTRVPFIWLNVFSDTDCSGIVSAGVGSSATTTDQNLTLTNGVYSGLVVLPALLQPGATKVPFVVRTVDGVGNVRLINLEVTLDETKPVLNAGGKVTATASRSGDLLQDLKFENVNVTDTQYPGGYWGVWVANATEPVADPLNDPNLKWSIREAPLERVNNGFTLKDWSLATGLTQADLAAGEDYYVYVRFLDGAGNPTDGVLTAQVTSTTLTRPKTSLPIIRR